MNKLIFSALAAAGLAAGGSVFAQASGVEGQGPTYGPLPGTPEYYGNSGWTPPPQPVYIYGNRAYYVLPPGAAPAYPYTRPDQRNRRDRGWDSAATRRDRDGDGVANRHDRFPDDPSRF